MIDKKVKRKYGQHKNNARSRGIEFQLTIEEWFKVWFDSGHFHERGPRKDQYVMARLGDKGPYAVGNVKIITGMQNSCEHRHRPEVKIQIGNSGRGQKRSAESVAKFKIRAREKAADQEYRKRLSIAVKKACARPEVKAAKSKAVTALWETSEYRLKMISKMQEACRTPEFREKSRQTAIRRWARQREKEAQKC